MQKWYSSGVQQERSYQASWRRSPTKQPVFSSTLSEIPPNIFSSNIKTPWFIGPVTKKPVIPRLIDCLRFLAVNSSGTIYHDFSGCKIFWQMMSPINMEPDTKHMFLNKCQAWDLKKLILQPKRVRVPKIRHTIGIPMSVPNLYWILL